MIYSLFLQVIIVFLEVIPPHVSLPFSGCEDRPRTPTALLLSVSGDVPEIVGCFAPSIHCFVHWV